MAKQVQRKARKDYPEAGIQKGDDYFFAQIKTGPRSSRIIRSKTRIPQSKMTSSAFLSTLYGIEESFETIVHDNTAPDALKDLAQQLRDLGEETQSSFDNMPDGLQQGDTGQMLEERISNCEQWADEIEQVADQLENTIAEIEDKKAEDLESLGYDPDEEGAEEPDEEAVQDARDSEITDAVAEAIEEATGSNPGFN
jgi:uncharacterized protein YukE